MKRKNKIESTVNDLDNTILCFLSVMFGSMSFITLGIPGDMRIATKY